MRLWLLASLSLPLPSSAQTVTGMTVSAYTARALESSPEVRAAEEALTAADAVYKAQWAAAALPTVSVTATAYPYGHNPAHNYEFQTWRLNRSDTSVNTTVDWNLFNSFQDFQRVRSAELSRQVAQRAALAARQDRAYAAIQAFYDLDSKNELLEVARQNVKAQHDQYVQSRDLYDNGMKSLADLLKSETDWRSSELRQVGAEADQKSSLVAFNVLIDRESLAPAALSAVLEPGATALPLLDGDTARALVQRPEVVRAQKDLERAKIAVEQAVQGFLPTFKADLVWNHTDTANFGSTPISASAAGIPNPNYYVGLSLSLPLGFNGVSQAYAVVQARAQRRSAESSLATATRAVRSEVAGAYIGLEKALRSYSVALVKEEIARRALDLVGNQYRQGSADAIRMNQAQNDFLDARVQRVLALHDIFIDRAQYKRAVGDSLW